MRYLVFVILLLLTIESFGQQFTIKRVEIEGNNVNLYYDLLDETPQRTYTVTIYSSHDNFVSQLVRVNGAVGLEVKPGSNKKIIWNAEKELGSDFSGKVGLEVRGRVYIPFVRLDGLNKKFKRDKPYEITWTGGTQQNILNFELYRNEEKITTFPNIANVGLYTLTMPTTVKPGKGYKFKITDTKNKDQIVYSVPFAVGRKVPLLLKVLPVALLGGGIYALVSGNKGPNDIPDPIVPPE